MLAGAMRRASDNNIRINNAAIERAINDSLIDTPGAVQVPPPQQPPRRASIPGVIHRTRGWAIY